VTRGKWSGRTKLNKRKERCFFLGYVVSPPPSSLINACALLISLFFPTTKKEYRKIPDNSQGSCGGWGSCFKLLVLAAFMWHLAVFAPRAMESLKAGERILLEVSEAVGGVNGTGYLHKVRGRIFICAWPTRESCFFLQVLIQDTAEKAAEFRVLIQEGMTNLLVAILKALSKLDRETARASITLVAIAMVLLSLLFSFRLCCRIWSIFSYVLTAAFLANIAYLNYKLN